MSAKSDQENQRDEVPEVALNPPPGKFLIWVLRKARRVVVFVIGSTVLLIGIAMIVLPGPAFVVIPLGLAILATEFVWAKRWLDDAKRRIENLAARATNSSRIDNNSTPQKK